MKLKTTVPGALALALAFAHPGLAQAPAPAPAPKMDVKVITVPAASAPMAASAEEVPGVDLSKLNPEQKKTLMKVIGEEKCSCGCSFTLHDCRTKDQKCPMSQPIIQGLVTDLLAGKTEADLRKGLAPKPAAAAAAPPAPLESKVSTFDWANAPLKGAKSGKVTIAEFSEFQCPWCSRAQPWLQEVLKAFPNDVRIGFKHYPLPMHQQAQRAAEASLAAHAQGKFWELHDKMFGDQRAITPEKIDEWAKEIGLDMVVFKKALDEGKYKAQVDKDKKEGEAAGVQGTPSFFINGKRYNGGRDLASVKPIIEAELKGGSAAAMPIKIEAKPAPAKTGM